MKKIMCFICLNLFLILGACHPLVIFHPPGLSKNLKVAQKPEEPKKAKQSYPKQKTEIFIDEHGVPHIYGQSREDVSYALGFMHARDRGFQLDALRRAGQGNLTPLFGEKVAKIDEKLRLLSFNLKEQYEALDNKDKKILQAYAQGVNHGIDHTGATIQHVLLGKDFEKFQPYESLAVARVQSWELANDIKEELIRAKINAKLGNNSKIKKLFFEPMSSGGIPIVENYQAPSQEFAQEKLVLFENYKSGVNESKLVNKPKSETRINKQSDELASLDLVKTFTGFEQGAASNSWVVAGQHTNHGRPILANDPHLSHRAPGVFYIAHLNVAGENTVGATIAGLPAVLIGHSDQHAWGATSSFADVQDLVDIKVDKEDKNYYWVDNRKYQFGLQNNMRTTIFGPVLPDIYKSDMLPNKTYALLWSGYVAGSINQNLITGFWDLGHAKNLQEAEKAVDKLTISALNVSLGFKNGDIAYRLAAPGIVRLSDEPINLPRDGSKSSGGWKGFLMGEQKPHAENTKHGYIVASNQRITENQNNVFGSMGTTPHRALRITQRLNNKIRENQIYKTKITNSDMASIQQDITNPEAKKFASYFGKICPNNLEYAAFCNQIKNFDGVYSVDSLGAYPYEQFILGLRYELLEKHLGKEVAEQLDGRYLSDAVVDKEINKLIATGQSDLFGSEKNKKKLIEEAFEKSFKKLEKKAGTSSKNWRWGNHHYLVAKGPLAKAPLLGGFFQTDKLEQPGALKTPRAEANLPVTKGAVFRMVVDLTDPIQGQMIMETGNSGHAGHEHFEDQFSKWTKGEFLKISTNKKEIIQNSEEGIIF